MHIAKTKQTRKNGSGIRAKTRRSTPPFSPLLMMGGGAEKDVFVYLVGNPLNKDVAEKIYNEIVDKTEIDKLLSQYKLVYNNDNIYVVASNGISITNEDYSTLFYNLREFLPKEQLYTYDFYYNIVSMDELDGKIVIKIIDFVNALTDNQYKYDSIDKMLKCVIYVTKNKNVTDSPLMNAAAPADEAAAAPAGSAGSAAAAADSTTQQTQVSMFDKPLWDFVKSLNRENGGTDKKQNELDLVAAALWKHYVRQLEKQMNDEIVKPAETK